MEISISPEQRKFIEEKVQRGEYRSIDDVIEAGLATLQLQESFGDFAPGELDKLLAEADEDFERGDVYEGDEVFREIEEMSKALRRETQK